MIYVLIPLLLLLAVWVGAVYRRLRELDDNIKIAMEQIGLQLSSRFRALEALLELLRSYGPSAQLVLPPPSIHALSTPAQVLEQEQRLAQAMSYVTAVAESRPAIKADKTYQRCIEAANCYNRMIYTSSLIYNDSVTRFNNTLKQKHFAPLAGFWALPRGNICSLHRTPRWSALPSPPRPLNRPLKKNPPEIVPAVSLQKTKASAALFSKTSVFDGDVCTCFFYIVWSFSCCSC